MLFSLLLFSVFSFSSIANTRHWNGNIEEKFKKIFPGAHDVSWYKEGDDYLAYFKIEQVTTRAILNKKGELVSYLRYYARQKLPPLILFKLSKKYPGATVLGVTEIYKNDKLIFSISLGGSNNHWMVALDSNGHEILEENEE